MKPAPAWGLLRDPAGAALSMLCPLLVVLAMGSAGAGEPSAADGATSMLAYTRLSTDSEGVSHFGSGELQLSVEDYSPPAGPMAILALPSTGAATLVMLPPGAFEDWHPVPRRQFAVVVRGAVEVTAGDGEVRRFGPGEILLLEDTAGSGHRTRVVSDDAHLALMVPVAAGALEGS